MNGSDHWKNGNADNWLYRLAYPDKFWKIVNFYYNSKKIQNPDKTVEKLDILVAQEKSRQRLIQVFLWVTIQNSYLFGRYKHRRFT